MLSFSRLAVLALPLLGAVFAEEPASPTKDAAQSNSIYSSAQEAFHDLLNALPEESLQAALSGLKDFQQGVFETHHRGVEQVHNANPALATKLIVAAVQDLQKRQTPSNGTSASPPPPSSAPPPTESTPAPPPQDSSPPTSNAPAESSTPDRAIIIPVPQTTTNAAGQTVVQTTSILTQPTASIPVTLVRTNAAGAPITTTETRPAVLRTTTDSAGRPTVITSAAQFAPTPGEVRTETDASGRTFLTTYTPAGGKISSVRLITTTGADGRPSTVTSYTFVDPAGQTGSAATGTAAGTGRPGLQSGAAEVRSVGLGYAVIGGAVAMLL